MKIDSDLRAAIRAAERVQPAVRFNRRETEAAAIKDLLRQNLRIATLVRRAKRQEERARELEKLSNETFCKVGFCSGLDYVSDVDVFRKAGGKLNRPERWTADKVIAELLAAPPTESRRIMKRYGIEWS